MSALSETIILQIIDAYQAGESRAQVGARYGIHKNTVGNVLKEYGVQMRPRNGDAPPAAVTDPAIRTSLAADYEAGMTYHQLMDKYNLTMGMVRGAVKAEGITPRSRGMAIKAGAWLKMLETNPEEPKTLYAAGATFQELADRYNVALVTVRKFILESGVQARRVGPARVICAEGSLHCNKCGKDKPLDLFSNSTKGYLGKASMCKDCERSAQRANLYGVSEEQYQQMLDDQGGGCAICRAGPDTTRNGHRVTLCVDHDHVTGRVRELICVECNKAYGTMAESPILIAGLLKYATKWATQPSQAQVVK